MTGWIVHQRFHCFDFRLAARITAPINLAPRVIARSNVIVDAGAIRGAIIIAGTIASISPLIIIVAIQVDTDRRYTICNRDGVSILTPQFGGIRPVTCVLSVLEPIRIYDRNDPNLKVIDQILDRVVSRVTVDEFVGDVDRGFYGYPFARVVATG